MKSWFFKHPKIVRWAFNLWPPFLFCGIWVEEIASDYHYARIRLRSSPLTKNINGSQYGGNLFSMTDPIYATLLLGILGWDKYYVWDKAAEIDYIKPGHRAVFFEAKVEDDWVAEIRQATAQGEKYLPEVEGYILDKDKKIVAHVKRKLYVRLRPEFRPTDTQ